MPVSYRRAGGHCSATSHVAFFSTATLSSATRAAVSNVGFVPSATASWPSATVTVSLRRTPPGTFSGSLTIGEWKRRPERCIKTGADVTYSTAVLGAYAAALRRVTVDVTASAGSTLEVAHNRQDRNGSPCEISDGAHGHHGACAIVGNNALVVGAGGYGEMSISSGSTVTANSLTIGDQAGGGGAVMVSGGGSSLTSSGDGTAGYQGLGVLILADGGVATLNGGAGTLHIASQAGSSGGLMIGGFDPTGAGHLSAASVQFGAGEGVLIFNHTETDLTFATPLTGSGTVLHAEGVTTLDGDSSGFTGVTRIINGLLNVNGALGGTVEVTGIGTLGGTGTVGNVTNSANIAPGNSIGILNVADLTMNPGSGYIVELNDSGNIAGVNNDIISATGAVTINGGIVFVTPENGTDDGSSLRSGNDLPHHPLYRQRDGHLRRRRRHLRIPRLCPDLRCQERFPELVDRNKLLPARHDGKSMRHRKWRVLARRKRPSQCGGDALRRECSRRAGSALGRDPCLDEDGADRGQPLRPRRGAFAAAMPRSRPTEQGDGPGVDDGCLLGRGFRLVGLVGQRRQRRRARSFDRRLLPRRRRAG